MCVCNGPYVGHTWNVTSAKKLIFQLDLKQFDKSTYHTKRERIKNFEVLHVENSAKQGVLIYCSYKEDLMWPVAVRRQHAPSTIIGFLVRKHRKEVWLQENWTVSIRNMLERLYKASLNQRRSNCCSYKDTDLCFC